MSMRAGEAPEVVEDVPPVPGDGYLWLAFTSDEHNWPEIASTPAGCPIRPEHITDSLNVAHPSFFDQTQDYDLVVFRDLHSSSELALEVGQLTIFLFGSLIVTVAAPRSTVCDVVSRGILNGKIRVPQRPAGLMHLILTTVVDRFMDLREPIGEQIDSWQKRLLDPSDAFNDWNMLMDRRAALERLSLICERQEEVVGSWVENTSTELDDWLRVRFSDVREHARRVQTFADQTVSRLESLVQLHFSAAAHHANEIMKLLTIVAAIFLPLGLVAGIFGMNFKYMPELELRYAYYCALGAMAAIGGGMLLLFKRKRWI